MNKKHYKISIRTNEEQRTTVIVEAESILQVVQSLHTTNDLLTFISNKHPDRESFSIFKHSVKSITYELVQNPMFERVNAFTIH